MPYEKKLYPDLDLSTPELFFAEVEKRLGEPVLPQIRMLMELSILMSGDIEGTFASAVHDCDKCPAYEMCGPKVSPHYRARSTDKDTDDAVAKLMQLLAGVDVDLESDPDRDTPGDIPDAFRFDD